MIKVFASFAYRGLGPNEQWQFANGVYERKGPIEETIDIMSLEREIRATLKERDTSFFTLLFFREL